MKNQRLQGFTLIELVVVIAIIGILAAIAIPQYDQYLRKSRRQVAKGDLTSVAQLLERRYTELGYYSKTRNGNDCVNISPTGDLGPTSADYSPMDEANPAKQAYDITLVLTSCTNTAWTLVATPKGKQAGDGILTLNSLGQKTFGAINSWN